MRQSEDQNQVTGWLREMTESESSMSPGWVKQVSSATDCSREHRADAGVGGSDSFSFGRGEFQVSGGHAEICIDIQEASRKIWDAVELGDLG